MDFMERILTSVQRKEKREPIWNGRSKSHPDSLNPHYDKTLTNHNQTKQFYSSLWGLSGRTKTRQSNG
jgi:hypothetical protein